jgi:hypothetical protein
MNTINISTLSIFKQVDEHVIADIAISATLGMEALQIGMERTVRVTNLNYDVQISISGESPIDSDSLAMLSNFIILCINAPNIRIMRDKIMRIGTTLNMLAMTLPKDDEMSISVCLPKINNYLSIDAYIHKKINNKVVDVVDIPSPWGTLTTFKFMRQVCQADRNIMYNLSLANEQYFIISLYFDNDIPRKINLYKQRLLSAIKDLCINEESRSDVQITTCIHGKNVSLSWGEQITLSIRDKRRVFRAMIDYKKDTIHHYYL